MWKVFRSLIASLGFALLIASGVQAEAISPQEASYHVGDKATVVGVVSQVSRSKGGTTFINFGGRYPNHVFYGVIFRNSAGQFTNIFGLEGRTMAISGRVKIHKGKPQIILSSPNQIQVQ